MTNSDNSSDGTERSAVPPENYELWDEDREELRCPFCDGRILRVGRYGECTDCGERFRKQQPDTDHEDSDSR
ncbi:hypothetical protein GCM10028856_17090 [Halopiger thermotolerans]